MEKNLRDVLPGAARSLLSRIEELSDDEREQLRDALKTLLTGAKRVDGKIVVGRDDELDGLEVAEVLDEVEGSKIKDEKISHVIDDARLFTVLEGRLGKDKTKEFIDDILIRSDRKIAECDTEIAKLSPDIESLLDRIKEIEKDKDKYKLKEIEDELTRLGSGPMTSEERKIKDRLESKKRELEDKGVTPEPRPDVSVEFSDVLTHPDKYGLSTEDAKKLKDDKGKPKIDEIKRALEAAKQKKDKLEEEKKVETAKKDLLTSKRAEIEKLAEFNERESEAKQEAREDAGEVFEINWGSLKRNISSREMREKLRELHDGDTGVFRKIGNAFRTRFLTRNARKEALDAIKREEKERAMANAAHKARKNAFSKREKSKRANIQKGVDKIISTGKYEHGSRSDEVFHDGEER